MINGDAILSGRKSNRHVDNLIFVIVPLMIYPNLLWRILNLGQGRLSFVSLIYIMVFVFLLCDNRRFFKIAFSWPMIIWAILTFYHLINATLKNVPEINYVDYLRGIKVYSSICIFTFFLSINAKKTFKVVYYNLGLWLFLAFLVTGYSSGQRLSGDIVIAVEFGKLSALMAIMGLYWKSMENEHLPSLLLKLAYPVVFVLLSQSRNAFGMIIIMFIGYYYTVVMRCKISIKQFVGALIVGGVLLLSVKSVVDHTGLGDRFVDDIESAEVRAYRSGTFLDYITGERLIYYVNGIAIFMEHPLTGIGLDNYQNYINGDYPMHVEYFVHLAEGGLIAAFLWAIFIIILFMIVQRSHIPKTRKTMAQFTLFTVLFTCLFSVMYKNELNMILFGLILSIDYPSEGNYFQKRLC